MARMEGLSIAGIKKHPMLGPLFFCIAGGACGAMIFLGRAALRSPDVSWNTRKNPDPWNDYKDKQYKLLSPHYARDVKSPAPTY